MHGNDSIDFNLKIESELVIYKLIIILSLLRLYSLVSSAIHAYYKACTTVMV